METRVIRSGATYSPSTIFLNFTKIIPRKTEIDVKITLGSVSAEGVKLKSKNVVLQS